MKLVWDIFRTVSTLRLNLGENPVSTFLWIPTQSENRFTLRVETEHLKLRLNPCSASYVNMATEVYATFNAEKQEMFKETKPGELSER